LSFTSILLAISLVDSSIKSDLDALEDEGILKVAGIVAFFRSVDRTKLF
jgi:hypothetical protein